jgi:predicted DNA-binding transcriptional regulator AlpA
LASIGRPRAALTIKEFCAAHGISRAQYYRLKKQGYAPDETRFGEDGKIVLITEESARKWRKRHTKPAVA